MSIVPKVQNRKMYFKCKVNKNTSNIFTRKAMSPHPQVRSPLKSPKQSIALKFDQFGDIETTNTSKKCNFDLSQYVSDKELDMMKTQIMCDYNRQDL